MGSKRKTTGVIQHQVYLTGTKKLALIGCDVLLYVPGYWLLATGYWLLATPHHAYLKGGTATDYQKSTYGIIV